MERKVVKRAMISDQRVSVLSSLPESILVHILSFLETKYAVRTSILSTRWKHLWASVQNLNFVLSDNVDSVHMRSFMNFADRVIHLHDSPCIRKFVLKSNRSGSQIDLHRLRSWISVVLKRSVQEIHIKGAQPFYSLYLPLNLFTSESLVVLSLVECCLVNLPATIYFPKLKTLKISVKNPKENITGKLFRSCPVLEDLSIDADLTVGKETTFDIYAPALKKLIISLMVSKFNPDEYEIMFLVDAPILECLLILDSHCARYLLKNPSILHTASVAVGDWLDTKNVKHHHAIRAFGLLRAISNVEHLELEDETMTAVCMAYNRLLTFRNVTVLELRVTYISWVPSVLQMMPTLELLIIYVSPLVTENDENLAEEMQMQLVPSCFTSHLRKIIVQMYHGREEELQLVKYLLKNSKVLQEMYFSDWQCEELKEKVQAIPMSSETCQLTFQV